MNCPNCQRPFIRARQLNLGSFETTHVDGTVCVVADASVLQGVSTNIRPDIVEELGSPTVTQHQARLLERSAQNLLAACEVIAPMIPGVKPLDLLKAANVHGMRQVLKAAGLLAK